MHDQLPGAYVPCGHTHIYIYNYAAHWTHY